jgi:signal transduction histidine kinase/CheY-like chemotaxis protein
MAAFSPKSSQANLIKYIHKLEQENEVLKKRLFSSEKGETVRVPKAIKPLFDEAQKTVGDYFMNLRFAPSQGTIEVGEERYVLVRASALSYDFLHTIQKLYNDRGEKEAFLIGKNFLFDISHVLGMSDAKNFHNKMHLTNPIAKLSAGPVHFAYSGWAFVEILEDSLPSPDNKFFLHYKHPYSFEADSWIKAGKKSASPVCIMNSGYSSGWCEESFGIHLTAVEVSCRACGDESCSFIMAPPDEINNHLRRYETGKLMEVGRKKTSYYVPTFFERKKVEEGLEKARIKAEESDQAKSDFLANMSHEIRTPMNTILGYADLMLHESNPNTLKDYLLTIKRSGITLQRLINDILDLSRIEAGQLTIEPGPYSLKAFFHFTENTLKGFALQSKSKVNFSSKIDKKLSDFISTDAVRLQQLMENLLNNAIKFTEKGKIEYGVKLKGAGMLEFYVSDTGIGILKKNEERIFEKFGQADSSITRRYGGSGLGLTISKRLAELMGGNLSFKSIPGKGSVFSFTIPYSPLPDPELKIEIKKNHHALAASKVVLLVEDHLVNQRLTRLILEKAGYRVIVASNGQEAIDTFLKTVGIGFVLMDMQMPVLDGLEATRQIRKAESKRKMPRTPIVAMTAHAMKGDQEKCLEAGCDTYVSKPFMVETLLNALGSIADLHVK